MDENLLEREKFETLNKEYGEYVKKVKRDWLPRNQAESSRVFEVMYPHEQAKVHDKIAAWGRYITPLAEAWWKERGYGVEWPEDNTKPMQVYKLTEAVE